MTARRSPCRSSLARLAAAPQVEALEDRCLPSISAVFLAQARAAAAPPAPAHPAAAPKARVIAPDYRLLHPLNQMGPFSSPGPQGYTPAQVRHAYGFDQISFNGTTGDGTGQTIAIVAPFDNLTLMASSDPLFLASDLHRFDTTFGLPDPVFVKINQTGGNNLPAPNLSWAVEEALDVEWAHAIAPRANILLVEANSTSSSDLYAAVRFAAAQPGVSVVAMSWGGAEYATEANDDATFTTPSGHAGVTFVAGSGDSGAPPSYPAVSPNVLAVGGTTLTLGASGNITGEAGWGNNLGSSGGGLSAYEGQPAYQNGVVTQSATQRANPDVAYGADPNDGFAVICSYAFGQFAPWAMIGGTSAGAPQWAALVAVVNQGLALNGLGSLDGPSQTLPALYRVPQGDFHDITTGTSLGTPHYDAGPGYDLVTGRGSPVANRLALDVAAFAPPYAPTGLTATALAADQIKLSWTASPGAVGYYVERSPDGSGWTVVGNTTGRNSVVFTDGLLSPATKYFYRVRAFNANGPSAYSNVANAATNGGTVSYLFADNFNGGGFGPAWSFVGGNWSEGNGAAAQTSTAVADPQKALLTDQAYPADVQITAKVRVDSWVDGDWARAGVGLYTDGFGQGYNLLFHGDTHTVQFLDDWVSWGNSYTFDWSVGTWYWFKLEDAGGALYGKVWADGTAEPTSWMFAQAGWTWRANGAPALNGGDTGQGGSTASFDLVAVTTPDDVAAPPAPGSLTATAANSREIDLSWPDVKGEAGFLVERSPDGSADWAQIGSTGGGVTGFADTLLSPTTTYYYRVRATNGAGSGSYSPVASATTPAYLFTDDFAGNTIGPAWTLVGGNWVQTDGVLAQTSNAVGDPKKAMLTDQAYPANVVVTAEVRVDSWADGDFARAGVGADTDGAGLGYGLVFHQDQHTVQFLDDHVAWGNSMPFDWAVGQWYWFTLEVKGGVLYGKVWADGTPEPTTWMMTQAGWADRTGGAPALNGGSTNDGGATVSFAHVSIYKA